MVVPSTFEMPIVFTPRVKASRWAAMVSAVSPDWVMTITMGSIAACVEQPEAIAKTVERHLKDDIIFPGDVQAIESALLTFEKAIIAASGSREHAGLASQIM